MANEKETLTDIATWLFVDFHETCPWLVDGGKCAGCPFGGNGKNCIFDKIANKISDAAERERGNLDALERACEEVLDADKLKAVVAAKRRIQGEPERKRVCRRSIEIPVKVVPTCSVARAQRRLELLRAEMSDMVNMPPGTKYCFSPQAVIAEIDDTLATRPRNCDVFADALWDTISRAWQDWLLTPEFNKRKIGSLKEFCYWFLGPAKESGVRK